MALSKGYRIEEQGGRHVLIRVVDGMYLGDVHGDTGREREDAARPIIALDKVCGEVQTGDAPAAG